MASSSSLYAKLQQIQLDIFNAAGSGDNAQLATVARRWAQLAAELQTAQQYGGLTQETQLLAGTVAESVRILSSSLIEAEEAYDNIQANAEAELDETWQPPEEEEGRETLVARAVSRTTRPQPVMRAGEARLLWQTRTLADLVENESRRNTPWRESLEPERLGLEIPGEQRGREVARSQGRVPKKGGFKEYWDLLGETGGGYNRNRAEPEEEHSKGVRRRVSLRLD
ncbi:hypothetical protein FB45DRAFT_867322 [Roridomyces roridus]|uniref:Mating-type protein A-alpha/beta 1 N-terminal domain-containing protein n=1 Tax=Roridomyces roridus TaxID=1738132 RepID=A0AAD7FLU5_9AGAR|nr:hypothetical protein FB45DRAFT_867318 [Roridomyces roridus]KAJ7631140.1 hypothetical protein FB45DRAFT_867322 [Roridomyces roridus]